MNLTYAVERLLETGWSPDEVLDTERLPDGRSFPSVIAVQREFARAGLELSIKQNLMFGCYRATWALVGEQIRQVLRCHSLFEPFRHERQAGAAHLEDVGAEDGIADAAALEDGETAGGFVGNDAGEAAAVAQVYQVADILPVHRRVGV